MRSSTWRRLAQPTLARRVEGTGYSFGYPHPAVGFLTLVGAAPNIWGRSWTSQEGGAVDVKAAVAFGAGEPLRIETVELEGPKGGEVLVEIGATGVCHTDEFTLSGADPEGLFPTVLGHEGAGVVVEVGPGVTSLAEGDHVIPLYTPECRKCKSCLSRKTNLCTAIRST